MGQSHASSSDFYTKPHGGDAWRADAALQGKTGTQRLLDVFTAAPVKEVREALQLAEGELVVTRVRLILADDQPVEIAASHYPERIAGGGPLAEPKKIRGGAVRVLAEAGYPLDESVDYVSADRPTADEAELLDVAADEPMIVLSRIGCRADGLRVEYAVNRMVAARVAPLRYRLGNAQQ